MAHSIYFYDVLSSSFFFFFFFPPSRQGSPSSLRCPCRSAWFPVKLQGEFTVQMLCILRSFKVHSPRTLIWGRILSRPLCFFRPIIGPRAKLEHARAYITRASWSPLHAKNMNFPDSLEPGKKHEVACASQAGGLLRVHSHLTMETVSHIIFLSVIFLNLIFFYSSGLGWNGIFPWQP